MTGWDVTMETGDALVDRQHRRIHALVADVEAAGDEPSEIRRILDHLMEHVDTHFATEEALMERIGFPEAERAAHVSEHRTLTEQARRAVLDFRTGELSSIGPVVEFLRGWLADHVHEHDKDFVEFVRARGGSAELP